MLSDIEDDVQESLGPNNSHSFSIRISTPGARSPHAIHAASLTENHPSSWDSAEWVRGVKEYLATRLSERTILRCVIGGKKRPLYIFNILVIIFDKISGGDDDPKTAGFVKELYELVSSRDMV